MPSARAAPARLQSPPSLVQPTAPGGKRHTRQCCTKAGARGDGEGRRAGPVWRREEGHSAWELCKTSARSVHRFATGPKVSQVSLLGLPSFKTLSRLAAFPADAIWFLSGCRWGRLVCIHSPARLGHSWLLSSRVQGFVKIQSTAWAAQLIRCVTFVAQWMDSKADFAPESEGCVHTLSESRAFTWTSQAAGCDLSTAQAGAVSMKQSLCHIHATTGFHKLCLDFCLKKWILNAEKKKNLLVLVGCVLCVMMMYGLMVWEMSHRISPSLPVTQPKLLYIAEAFRFWKDKSKQNAFAGCTMLRWLQCHTWCRDQSHVLLSVTQTQYCMLINFLSKVTTGTKDWRNKSFPRG